MQTYSCSRLNLLLVGPQVRWHWASCCSHHYLASAAPDSATPGCQASGCRHRQQLLTVQLLQFEGEITALATKDNATFAAVGHNIVACQRVHQ